MERRLAATLAADVVGYCRLTGDDEAGTLVRLSAALRSTIPLAMRSAHYYGLL